MEEEEEEEAEGRSKRTHPGPGHPRLGPEPQLDRRLHIRTFRGRVRYRSTTRSGREVVGTWRAGHGGSHLSDTGAGTTTAVRRGVRATQPQGVTFVELFFDLVFVFAVTQITAATAADLTASGVLRAVLVGWLVWWAWTQFTWTLNPADTSHTAVRTVVLIGTAVRQDRSMKSSWSMIAAAITPLR